MMTRVRRDEWGALNVKGVATKQIHKRTSGLACTQVMCIYQCLKFNFIIKYIKSTYKIQITVCLYVKSITAYRSFVFVLARQLQA